MKDDNVLLRFGESELLYSDVIESMPDGVSPSDSAALFQAIVDGWVRDVVLVDLAEQRLYDIDAIERRVKDYRNNLIVSEYLSRMRESQEPKVDELRVKEYYDKHRKELKLEVPLVRGVFLKIDSEAKGKEKIKKMLESEDSRAIDNLEQEWFDRALEYNYFRDKWIDWKTLEGMIPYRFGNPEEFVKNYSYFETQYGDCIYYLQISDYLLPGEEQPYDFASSWIKGMLTQGDLADYEKALVESIVSKSLKEKKLVAIGYDPLKHELKENSVIVEDEKE